MEEEEDYKNLTTELLPYLIPSPQHKSERGSRVSPLQCCSPAQPLTTDGGYLTCEYKCSESPHD